jgi:hypothetical protein
MPAICALSWHAVFVTSQTDLVKWLRDACSRYAFAPEGVYQAGGIDLVWPLTAANESDLLDQLNKRGNLLPLPKEPAALANVLEVSIADFLADELGSLPGAALNRGTERGYPDLEFTGSPFNDEFHAVDIKVARRGVTDAGRPSRNTQSRITLYTGNTYFKHPKLEWPGGILRPFADYKSHIDVVVLYTFDESSSARVRNIELVVHPAWKIASTKRSSNTREYIGAVTNMDALRQGRGEFATEVEFYKYWRSYKFKTADAVDRRLTQIAERAE